MLTLLPVILAATPAQRARLGQPREFATTLALGLAAVAITAAAVVWVSRPFVLLTLPLLVAALQVRLLGTTIVSLFATVTLLAVYRITPDTSALGLSGLRFHEVILYASMSLLAPLLVAVQAEHRRASQRALRSALQQVRLITDHMPAAMGKLDARGCYEVINRRYADLLGVPAEDALGRSPREVLGDAHADAMAEYAKRAMSGENVTFEATVKRRELEVHYVPHVTSEGVQGFFVLALDLTARKSAERALFEEKERIRVTLDSIGDAVVACDMDMRVTLLNPIAEDMTGWPESEALGRPFEEVVQFVDLATGNPPLSPLRVALLDDRIVSMQMDMALVRRDGLRFPIEDSAAPIHDGDGRVIGGVMVFHDVSETRAMAIRMSHQAQHDHLTGLPNRVLLQDRLAHALSIVDQGARGALMFVDLDHFKTINDSLGHEVGDLVLQEVARRLQSTVRPDDTVSRQGGDEFVVLLARLRDPRDAARVAEKMLESMEEPMLVDGNRLHVSLSIGIALYPQDADDMRGLMRQADAALYDAKHAGRGRYSYFARSMSERAEQRLRLENDLRAALDADGLFLVYQPKVRRPDGAITGMEALVRWRREDGVLVPPLDFIPVAEESGLISLIDAWVMRDACRQAREWLDAGLLPGPVAVNVSLARFDADRLLALVASVLEDTGLPGAMLEVEFTESQMFADRVRAGRLIEGLRAMQVRIAVDDFGTGYSNLGYLSDHCFDTIKIDRSFIKGLPMDTKQAAVVQAIVAMAGALEAEVVAEGVETAEQATTLDGHGCRQVQGFLYSRPVPAEEFAGLLRRSALPEIPLPA
jgi:diguanylate cyclase (GGDEF)-like protein/PAS domain S-box-containing protein